MAKHPEHTADANKKGQSKNSAVRRLSYGDGAQKSSCKPNPRHAGPGPTARLAGQEVLLTADRQTYHLQALADLFMDGEVWLFGDVKCADPSEEEEGMRVIVSATGNYPRVEGADAARLDVGRLPVAQARRLARTVKRMQSLYLQGGSSRAGYSTCMPGGLHEEACTCPNRIFPGKRPDTHWCTLCEGPVEDCGCKRCCNIQPAANCSAVRVCAHCHRRAPTSQWWQAHFAQ